MKNIQLLLILFILSTNILAQPSSIINKKDTSLFLPFVNGKATFSYNGKMGIIDSTGEIILPATFDRISRLYNKDGDFPYYLTYNNRKPAILDKNYRQVISFGDYTDIELLRGNYFKVKKNGKFSFVDTSGKCFNQWFDKWGFISTSGEVVIPFKFDVAWGFNDIGLAGVKTNKKWGFIDTKGDFIIEPIYSKISFFYNGFCAVKVKRKWGYVDSQGKVVIPFIYDDANFFDGFGIASVKKNGKYGFINSVNEIIIPFNYFKAYSFSEYSQVTLVRKHLLGNWYYINRKGDRIKN
jgi:hypothetical protein